MFNSQLQWSAGVLDYTVYLKERKLTLTVILFITNLLNGLKPTSSGEILRTGMPLTSST